MGKVIMRILMSSFLTRVVAPGVEALRCWDEDTRGPTAAGRVPDSRGEPSSARGGARAEEAQKRTPLLLATTHRSPRQKAPHEDRLEPSACGGAASVNSPPQTVLFSGYIIAGPHLLAPPPAWQAQRPPSVYSSEPHRPPLKCGIVVSSPHIMQQRCAHTRLFSVIRQALQIGQIREELFNRGPPSSRGHTQTDTVTQTHTQAHTHSHRHTELRCETAEKPALRSSNLLHGARRRFPTAAHSHGQRRDRSSRHVP